jgi:hypothetical protein
MSQLRLTLSLRATVSNKLTNAIRTPITAIGTKNDQSLEFGVHCFMRNTSSSLIAYKRGASLNSSTWYKSTLLTFLAESKDTVGNYSLAEASLRPGNEPLAHL